MDLPTLDKFPKQVLATIDIQRAFIASRLVVAAERLQVFRTLHGKRRKASAIGRALKINRTYRDIFLNSLTSLGLLHKSGDTYSNTRLADKYFVDERSVHWTRQYSKECVDAYETLTVLEDVAGVRAKLRVDQGDQEAQLYRSHEARPAPRRRLHADVVSLSPRRC